ncbi:MAG: hypothetical protein Q4D22_00480 [Candidatus Saccharibacteria bacterium]|nr:hypothetical protein [Candidatus Saccharibacteria bacterium]
MKKRIAIFVVLMMVFCLALTGCAQKTGNQESNQTGNQASSQTNTPEPAEDFSQTPESLEGTAWILKGETDPDRCLAFFFKDGVATIVNGSFYFPATYYYENHILQTDPEEVGYEGEVNGATMSLTYFQEPYYSMTRVNIAEALQYARNINPECKTPFDDDYPGLDFDTGDSGIMDGSNNGDGGNNGNTDNSNPRYENGQYVYIVAGKEIRLSVNVWDYTNIGSKRKSLDWKGLLEHYGYTNPNSTRSQYMSTDSWKRIEIGYIYWDSYNTSGIYIETLDRNGDGIGIIIRESHPDYSEGYVFSIGEEPGDIVCMILIAYAAEQLPNNPASNPFAELFSEYRVSNSTPYEYVIP